MDNLQDIGYNTLHILSRKEADNDRASDYEKYNMNRYD